MARVKAFRIFTVATALARVKRHPAVNAPREPTIAGLSLAIENYLASCGYDTAEITVGIKPSEDE